MLAMVAPANIKKVQIKKYSVFIYSKAEPHAMYVIYINRRLNCVFYSMYVRPSIRSFVRTYVRTYACMFVCKCVCMCVCVCVCVCVFHGQCCWTVSYIPHSGFLQWYYSNVLHSICLECIQTHVFNFELSAYSTDIPTEMKVLGRLLCKSSHRSGIAIIRLTSYFHSRLIY